MGFKGYIQLAIRTGQYRHLNADAVYEGEEMIVDKIKGTMEITGKKMSDKVIGYFSYMKLINGFEKAIAWTKEDVQKHAKRFSKSYKSKYDSPWKSDFDAMAKKTMLLQLIPKYGPMTIEMTQALEGDRGDFAGFDDKRIADEIDKNANQGDVIDIEENWEPSEEEKKEILEGEMAEMAENEGPDF